MSCLLAVLASMNPVMMGYGFCIGWGFGRSAYGYGDGYRYWFIYGLGTFSAFFSALFLVGLVVLVFRMARLIGSTMLWHYSGLSGL